MTAALDALKQHDPRDVLPDDDTIALPDGTIDAPVLPKRSGPRVGLACRRCGATTSNGCSVCPITGQPHVGLARHVRPNPPPLTHRPDPARQRYGQYGFALKQLRRLGRSAQAREVKRQFLRGGVGRALDQARRFGAFTNMTVKKT